MHGLKVINSVDHIVTNEIQFGPTFISPESVKNIACVDKKNSLNLDKKQSSYDLLKTTRKT